MYHYNHHTYDVAFCIFSCKTLSNFHKLLVKIAMCDENKRIDLVRSIISKYHGIFTENFIIFFSNAGKTGNMSQFDFEIFKKTIFER